MSPHPPPQPGDVVVRHDRRQNVDLYVLRTVPGTDQYLLGSRDEAIVHATGYAKDRGVGAWLDDHSRLTLIRSFRTVQPARAAATHDSRCVGV